MSEAASAQSTQGALEVHLKGKPVQGVTEAESTATEPEKSPVAAVDDLPDPATLDWGDLAIDDDSAVPTSGAEAQGESEPESEPEPESPAPAPEEGEPEPVGEPEPAHEPEVESPAEDASQVQPAAQSAAKKEAPRVSEPPQEQPVDVDALWRNRETTLVEHYKISEEQGDAIIRSPDVELPRQFARIQAGIERMIWENLQQILPSTVGSIIEQRQQAVAHQDAFYEAWPQLKARVEQDPGTRTVIDNMRNLFKQQNPELSEEDVIQQVGAAATIALRVPLEPPTPTTPAAPSPPPPARPAAVRQPASAKPKLGQIEQFMADLEADEAGSSVVY